MIGGMGDRVGRKPAMVVSFTLMGVAIAGLALTPPYDRRCGAGARARQFVIAWFLSVTNNRLAPAYLRLGAASVGLVAMLLVKESSPARAAARPDVQDAARLARLNAS